MLSELAQRAVSSEGPALARRVAIRNPATNIFHPAPAERGMSPPALWRTTCGWRFGCCLYEQLAEAPEGAARCRKCFGPGA